MFNRCQTGSLRFHDDIVPLQFLFTLVVMAVTARPSFLIHEGHGLGADEPKLISQSVHLHEVPTKVIKITKTVAIKVPVPYPVKVSSFILEKIGNFRENESLKLIERLITDILQVN